MKRLVVPRGLLVALRSLVLVLVGGVTGALLARSSGWSRSDPPRIAPPRTEAEAPATPSSSPPLAGVPDVISRAASGELSALKELESSDDHSRTTAQADAIARGRTVLALGDLASLERSIEATPALAGDRATLARLHDFIEREPIAIETLGVVARLPGSSGGDLLHAVWRHRGPTTLGLLARDLARGDAVRARVTPSLAVTIELEELLEKRPPDAPHVERRCESVQKLLARLADVADRRCLPILSELDVRTGCGDAATGDCYACLRDGDVLGHTRDEVKKRPAPTPWILPGKRH